MVDSWLKSGAYSQLSAEEKLSITIVADKTPLKIIWKCITFVIKEVDVKKIQCLFNGWAEFKSFIQCNLFFFFHHMVKQTHWLISLESRQFVRYHTKTVAWKIQLYLENYT